MLLSYVLNDFGMVRAAPSVTGITFVFHSTCAIFLLCDLYILESPQCLS